MAIFSSFFGVPAIRSHVCANFSIDIVAAGATRPGSCATLRHGLLPEVTVVGRTYISLGHAKISLLCVTLILDELRSPEALSEEGSSNKHGVLENIVAFPCFSATAAGTRGRRGNPRGRPGRTRRRYDAFASCVCDSLPHAERRGPDAQRTSRASFRETQMDGLAGSSRRDHARPCHDAWFSRPKVFGQCRT